MRAEAERGEMFSPERTHEAVTNYFDGSGENQRIALAANIKRLKRDRVRADYHEAPAVDARAAQQALTDAKQLLSDWERLTPRKLNHAGSP